MADQQVERRAGTAPPRAEQPRRDPFRHGDLPQRPNYLPEEGDVGKSDVWGIVWGVVAAIAVIAGLALLVAQ